MRQLALLPLLCATAPVAAQPAAPGPAPVPGPVSPASAEHYTWTGIEGRTNDAWHLVKQADLSVIEESVVPGSAEARHLHTRARQFFRVLSGTLTMRLPTGTVEVPEGSGIEVPPGTPHQAANTTAAPVRFIVVSSPPSHGDRTDLAP